MSLKKKALVVVEKSGEIIRNAKEEAAALIRNIGSDAEGGVVCGLKFHQIEARHYIPLQNCIYKQMAES